MKVTVIVEIGERTVVEQITRKESFRGDYRSAIAECAGRVELSTFGPQLQKEGFDFDEQLKMGPPPT
jgi:hypothetical protein